jgi:hypothetical protein
MLAMSKSTKDTIGITFQEGKGYKKCIGWYQHEDGRRLPKIHWLGHDQEHALYLAHSLGKAWQIMQGDGPRGWTAKDVANVKAYITITLRDALKGMDDRQRLLDEQRELAGKLEFMLPSTKAAAEPDTAVPKQVGPFHDRKALLVSFQRHLQQMQRRLRRPLRQYDGIQFRNARQLRPTPAAFIVEKAIAFSLHIACHDFRAVDDQRHLLAVRRHVLPQRQHFLLIKQLPGLLNIPLDVCHADPFQFPHTFLSLMREI